MLTEAMLEAFEVFVSILCFCLLPHSTPKPCPSVLQTYPLNFQVTMEEEDESRGKTEESVEDRGDGPPDRDPTLSSTAFILVRLLNIWGQGRRGWESGFQGLTPGPQGEAGLGACTLGSSEGFESGCRVSRMPVSQE